MRKVAFITCADLSRFSISKKNASLTHDDQLAADYLNAHDIEVKPVVWGEDIEYLKSLNLDALIVRSPWDYMDSKHNSIAFFSWLIRLEQEGLTLLNPCKILQWNLDKHYLIDLKENGVMIPETLYLEEHESLNLVSRALKQWKQIVLKPCISAAAKDTYLISADNWPSFTQEFAGLRKGRAFMVQPFLSKIQEEGEWSCVFLNEQYSHAVVKKPKKGNWLVQDEQGGSVESLKPPIAIVDFAQEAFENLRICLRKKLNAELNMLYARVDILPGMMLGELELVEPELFFLNRSNHAPNENALRKFHEGIIRFISKET